MSVHAIADQGLGNTSYLVDLGGELAASVDPARDVDTHLELAERHGLRIVAVLETHLHADFVSGGRELAEAVGAEVLASGGAELAYPHRGVDEAHLLALGDTEFRVLATPGHTPEHVSYLMLSDGEPAAVFSGGSLIAGGAARTDLTSPERTEKLARAQFSSLRRLAGLPDATALHPTHGAGSFCSTGPAEVGVTTIGAQRRTNPLLAIDDEDAFVRELLAGYGSYPHYFLHLRDVNRRPPLLRELEPPRALDPSEAAAAVEGGARLVDARPIGDWAEVHPAGAVSIQLRPVFASWLGWVVPFGTPIVLLVDPGDRQEAIRQARRIGYDTVLGWVDGGVEAWKRAGLPVGSVEEVTAEQARARTEGGAVIVDVRQDAEVATGRIPGAVPIELGAIADGHTPEAGEVIVHCGHGERSATAASLLSARGLRVANLVGGLQAWQDAGLPVER